MDKETNLAEVHALTGSTKDAAGGELPKKYSNAAIEKSITNTTFNGIEPTEEELSTLLRVADRLPLSAWLIAIVEFCERFTYYGASSLFQNYIQYGPNDSIGSGSSRIHGAIGLGQSGATGLSYFFQFFCYITPIFGAIIADQYLGKYKTICVFAGIYLCGIAILFFTSLPVAIANGAALGGLVTAMIIIGLGTGGIKSNVSPLIAEQYTNNRLYVKTKKNGTKVIVDPSITIQRIFMFFYAAINLGSLVAVFATTFLEHNVGFWAAYLVPFLVFFLAIFVLVIGRNQYVTRKPKGSIIPMAFKVVWIGLKNRNLDAAKQGSTNTVTEASYPWTNLFVDEVRRALVACRIFLFFPIYWVVYGQMVNNFVSQAGTMELHGMPNDLMQNIDPLAVIIFIPILDKLIYPGLRKIGIRFLPITRIFWGFMCAAIAMAYAAIVQHIIYSSPPCYSFPLAETCMNGEVPNQVHVAIQTPAYVFIALSEIFASITGLEYAFSKAPPSMKSFIMSLFLFTNAIGAAIGTALSPTSKDPKLVWMYTGLACATFVAGVVFWILFGRFNKTEDSMNALDLLDEDVPVPVVSRSSDEENNTAAPVEKA